MPAHLGVQIASHLLARSTIQTAVVMSAGLGTGKGYGNKYRHAACELQLGALRLGKPVLDIELIEVYESESSSRYKNDFTNWFKKTWDAKHPYFQDRDELKVDLVLTPIDGAKALWKGESGSVSVAAAAPRGTDGKPSFCKPSKEATGYLVIAVGPEQADDPNLDEYLAIDKKMSLTDLGNEFALLQRILKQAPPEKRHVLGLMVDPYEKFMPPLPPMQCIRRLQGSAVAAALAAFCGKLPWSVFFSRLPQLMQASVAARGLKGRLYAIPLRDENELNSEKQKDGYNHVKVLPGRIFNETDFVKSENAVVCCSSISEVCVLDRVRFETDGTAITDTLTVSLVSHRATRQSDRVPLDSKMRGPDGQEVTGGELVEAFRQFLLSDTKSSVLHELEQLQKKSKVSVK